MALSTAAKPGRRNPDERNELIKWRYAQLRRSGYPDDLAAEIAARIDIDLHQATTLTETGCPPTTAARILL